MRQGLHPEIRHALIGTVAPATPEALKMAAEAIEIEMCNISTDAPATTADIRALISELRAANINHAQYSSQHNPTIAQFYGNSNRGRRRQPPANQNPKQ